MKKKLKQTTSALLVAAMTAAAVAGCASDTKDSSDDSANQQSTKVDLESVSELTFDASKFTTAADNGIDLPDLGGEPLKLKVNAAMYQMSPDGTQMQQFWEEAMEHYLGCDIEIEWSWTNSTDYANNELVILQSGQLPDVASVTKGTAVNEYGEAGLLLNLADYED